MRNQSRCPYNSRVVPSVTELKVECCAVGSLTRRRCECMSRVIRLRFTREGVSLVRSVHQAAVHEMPNPINKTKRPTALTIKTFGALVNQLISKKVRIIDSPTTDVSTPSRI